MRDEFSTFDLGKALGLPWARLREWINREYVPCKRAKGKGDKTIFTRADVYAVELFNSLLGSGFSRNVAGMLVKHFLKQYEDAELKATAFIIFRVNDGPRDPIIKVDRVTSPYLSNKHQKPSVKLDIETGMPERFQEGKMEPPIDWSDSEDFSKYWPKTWDRILLVNFQKIREKVDKALAVLE